MSKALLICALIVGLAVPVAAQELAGYTPQQPSNPPDRPEDLYHGDLNSEMGLGCTNDYGTWGGPNDVAQGVTATIAPPFYITQHYYYVYTITGGPFITALSFVCWQDQGAGPGMEFARQTGLRWGGGGHTVAIDPPIPVGTMVFYFGQNQPQTNVGMNWGLDTGSSAQRSYIRAPACGAHVFTLVDALGYPGNWCFSVTVDQPTPVELNTWGSLKALFH